MEEWKDMAQIDEEKSKNQIGCSWKKGGEHGMTKQTYGNKSYRCASCGKEASANNCMEFVVGIHRWWMINRGTLRK